MLDSSFIYFNLFFITNYFLYFKVLAEDDKFLITSDRDEKIRVSCFPNSYSIHTFCLGHLE